MNLTRIKGVLLQELFITKRSLEVIVDVFFFSLISIVVNGLIFRFLTGSSRSLPADYILIGTILWEIIRINQYSVTVGSLWNIWSRNLSNMFIAPLSLPEYIGSHMFSGFLKSLIVFCILSIISFFIFDFNIFELGFINLILTILNLTLFAWSIGLIALGFIFQYGTRIQALAWSVIFLFQPLSATYFPLQILPGWLQSIAYLFPSTYVFESARYTFVHGGIQWQLMGIALVLNCVYFLGSSWIFHSMFTKARTTGQFARNEG